ncbi:hypothetical protein PIB30_074550 [Stylosanthes scabra]|uniref:FAR1 domain-containing protein n=1 Tax=Stylosanthes scabra TaxID=79078 RepID=A0ABU6SPW5_9FABA|nr:hypothetical protein [Stylosanthes scabra]
MDSDVEDSWTCDNDSFGMHSDKEFSEEENDEEPLKDDYENVEDEDQTKRIPELSRDDIMQLEFTNEEAVHRFYKTYARIHGFAVRLDEGARKEKVEKDERTRDHRPLTRSMCPAKIRASLDRKSSKWKVVSFYEKHSHDLVDPMDVNMMPEYRKLS